ncbi:MAG: Hpt domain-containing protein [Pseudomonadota bacterium]|nr:Hpt domain-containing protein [Pseudomonadota bacterium]
MVDLSLLQDFIAETAEYLEEMEEGLLRLEADPGNQMMLDDIFRSIHTIKGAAEYLGIERIAELSRTAENLLYQLRRSELMVSQDEIELLMLCRKRIGLLTEDLGQSQTEQVEIDDLIERIRIVDTTSQISEGIDRAASKGDDAELPDKLAEETKMFADNEDDEELLAIFLGQLEGALIDLQTQMTALHSADNLNRIAILDFCLDIINPLHSSAHYMGYDQLNHFYEKWVNEIERVKEQLGSDNDEDEIINPFIIGCMEANIATLASQHPTLQVSEPEPTANVCQTDEEPSPPTASTAEILCDESDNPGDILEEYAETMPSPPATSEMTNVTTTGEDENLFERLSWSFDNRIKQNGTKQTETNLTEIESELFSSAKTPTTAPITEPETLNVENKVTTVISDVQIPTVPTISAANSSADIDKQTSIEEIEFLPIADNYEEDNDEELFTIFQNQLKEKLSDLQTHTTLLQKADGNNQIAILKTCLKQIDKLCFSANYMGYAELTAFYEEWTKDITEARVKLQNHEDGFMPTFIAECMQGNISKTINRFPHLTILETIQPAVKPVETLSSNQSATASETPEPAVDEDKQIDDSYPDNQPTISDTSMLPDFIVETREHLEDMEDNLLAFDTNSDKREALDDIFRSIHTIKGSAEYLGIERIAKLTHNLENLLYQLRQNELTINREIIDLLMSGWDRITLLTDNLEQNQIEQAPIDDLLGRIQLIDGSSKTSAINETTTDNEEPEAEIESPEIKSEETTLKEENKALLKGTDRRNLDDQKRRRQSDKVNEKTLKQSIRVDAGKIDALMNQVGELVVSRAGFTQLLSDMQTLQDELKQKFKLDLREMRQLSGMTTRLSEATALFGLVTNELQEEVMKVRMLPISQLFNRYPRLVFDLVRDSDKQVELDIHGEDTELDKMVIEEISDPLIHIIRNAIDHGIESKAERLEKGKPEAGTIRLKAYHEGNHVVIEIMDDGRGLDLNRIKEKALTGKFASLNELEEMSPREITGLIMKPGFSTADSVTHISGRGVGMDVVRKNIEKLNGTIEIETTPGASMHFRIKIPLTLAIIPALRIKAGLELFTIPLSTVEETLRISQNEISTIEGAEVMTFRGSTLPLITLTDLFSLGKSSNDPQWIFVVVVSTGMKRMGLIVDSLLGQEEIVIKPLEDYIQEKSGFSGATILGDGRISLILDVYELINLSINKKIKKFELAGESE